MSIEELKEKLFILNGVIGLVLDEIEYDEQNHLNIDFDSENKEECMLYDTFSDLLHHLDYTNLYLDYLKKPVLKEGKITKSKSGEYKLKGIVLEQGQCVEVLKDNGEWRVTIVGNLCKLRGEYARVRG